MTRETEAHSALAGEEISPVFPHIQRSLPFLSLSAFTPGSISVLKPCDHLSPNDSSF